MMKLDSNEDIIVITCKGERGQVIASHGMGRETLASVTLPGEPPSSLGARLDEDLGEWVIRSRPRRQREPEPLRILNFGGGR